MALDQGRISWRHDSILKVIEKHIKMSLINTKKKMKTQLSSNVAATESYNYMQSLKLSFVKEGCNTGIPMAKKKKLVEWWGTA